MLTVNRINEIIKEHIKIDVKHDKSPEGIYVIENHNPTIVSPGNDAFRLNSPGVLKLREQKSVYCDRVIINLSEGEKIITVAIKLMRQKAKEYLDSLGLTDQNIVLNYEFLMPGYEQSYCRFVEGSEVRVEIRYFMEIF